MQLSLAALRDSPVVADDKRIGRVWRVAFDLTNGTVLGILLDQETVAYADAVTSLEEAQVVVAAVEPVREGSLVHQAAISDIHIMGAAVRAEDGTALGSVSDALITFPVPQLHSIVAESDEGERLISRTNIISMSHEQVIVRSDLAKKVFDWNGAVVNASPHV